MEQDNSKKMNISNKKYDEANSELQALKKDFDS